MVTRQWSVVTDAVAGVFSGSEGLTHCSGQEWVHKNGPTVVPRTEPTLVDEGVTRVMSAPYDAHAAGGRHL